MNQSGAQTSPAGRQSAGSAVAVARKRYHFIGAGGVGMSGLAKLLMKNGAVVTGSDMEDSAVIGNLRELGADIQIGHGGDNVPAAVDTVVISAAIKDDNPELALARERGCQIYKYARMLGELMDDYSGIAVCGTHGKSTTGGWLTFVMQAGQLKPNYIIGADILQLDGASGVDEGRYFIAEACEYDRSFLNFRPRIAVILNIEQDHLDYYSDEDEIVSAFAKFAGNVKPGGLIIANGMDANVSRALEGAGDDIEIVTFGLGEDCDFWTTNIELVNGLYTFDVYHHENRLGRCKISLPGEHNISNALAVIAVSVSVGIKPSVVLGLVGQFLGMDRRLMLKGSADGIVVLDDYAHHPTEIRASLQGIRQRYGPGRIWCVFQPHQYSRTRFLLDDFAESFKLADITIVPEIYFVRDTAESKDLVNAQVLVERIRGAGSKAVFIDDFGDIVEHLKQNVGAGELVVTMGAGDIWKVADAYIQWLGDNS